MWEAIIIWYNNIKKSMWFQCMAPGNDKMLFARRLYYLPIEKRKKKLRNESVGAMLK